MKIAIDISSILYSTGVSKYTELLVENLIKIAPNDKFILFGGSLRRYKEFVNKTIKFNTPNSNSRILPLPPTLLDIIWNRIHVFPPEKLLGKFDILHTSDWTEPPSYANKVTTVHDLYHFKFPKMVHPKILDVHIRKMKWVIKESKVIIVPSLVTKEDLVDLGVEEQRIKIIPEAPLLPMVSKEYIETVKKKYKLREDYVVSNGVTVRKNTLNLIKAFNLTKHGRDMKLVLTGRPVGIKIPDERNIRLLGHVESDSELSAIIAGSRGMIFPSLYEGFGLPILEGFNLGVPVVTSNISSMPEVAGGAAVLVNPYDVNSIAEGIEEALSKPKTLIAKGLKVVSNYSWEKNAKETLEVYKSLL